MILAEPPHSQGDLHFRALGIPVRIHPFFWIVTLLLGLQGDSSPAAVIVWIVAAFVSILVHEMGHALVQRRFGGRPRIVLYGMGGLAACDDCDRSSRAQVLISFAGPMAGFCFAGMVLTLIVVAGHQVGWVFSDKIPFESLGVSRVSGAGIFGGTLYWEPFESASVDGMVHSLLWINVLWGTVNLLPIYPLDGGRISREVCQSFHPREGILLSLRISIVAAGLMSFVGLSWGSLLVVLFFGYLAYSSYQTLQRYQSSRW